MRNTWQSLVKKMKAIGETQEGLAEKLNVTQGSIAYCLLLIGYLAGENLI